MNVRPHAARVYRVADLRDRALLGLPCVSIIDGGVTDLPRDWRHAWAHAACGYEAFGIWLAARWLVEDEYPEDTEGGALARFVEIAGRLPTEREADLPLDVAAYAADPEVERVAAGRDPSTLHRARYHAADPSDPF